MADKVLVEGKDFTWKWSDVSRKWYVSEHNGGLRTGGFAGKAEAARFFERELDVKLEWAVLQQPSAEACDAT